MQLIPRAKSWKAAEWSLPRFGNPCPALEGEASRLPVSAGPGLEAPLTLSALLPHPLIYAIQDPCTPGEGGPGASQAAAPNAGGSAWTETAPRLLPRKFTLRAAARKQQPDAGHLLIGESRAALHLLPAPWKSLLLAFQGGSLLQSSRAVDKHQSHGENQMLGGGGNISSFFFFSPVSFWYCCGWNILTSSRLCCLSAYKYICFVLLYKIYIHVYPDIYSADIARGAQPLSLEAQPRPWEEEMEPQMELIFDPLSPVSAGSELPWLAHLGAAPRVPAELSSLSPAPKGKRPLELWIRADLHPRAATHSYLTRHLGGIKPDKSGFHDWPTDWLMNWVPDCLAPEQAGIICQKRGAGKQRLKSIVPSLCGLCTGSWSTQSWQLESSSATSLHACTQGRQTSSQELQLHHRWDLTLLLCCGVTPHQ